MDSQPGSAARSPGQATYPTGNDAIATFRVEPAGGRLSFTGEYTAVGTPSIIVFLERPPAPQPTAR